MINRRQRSNGSKRLRALSVILLILLVPVSISCGGGKQKQDKDAVATVNGASVSLPEFQKELAIYAGRNPDFKLTAGAVEEQLNMFIDKQLMIQEAMKMGLAEDERFHETIKRFWEQTLIRELIDAKSREWGGRLIVTEDEILAYYQEIKPGWTQKPLPKDVHDEIRLRLIEQKKQKAMEEWLIEVRKNASIKIDAKRLSESYK